MKFLIDGNSITVETNKFRAVMKGACLQSLTAADGAILICNNGESGIAPIEVIDQRGNALAVGTCRPAKTEVVQTGNGSAEVFISDWEADAAVRIELEESTGELLVSPSITALRKGVAGVRWNLAGIGNDLYLIAPSYQGIRAKLEDPLIAGERLNWPRKWEAGIAILQGLRQGFSVCCHDTRYRYKALKIGHTGYLSVLGLDTENYGPRYEHQAAGGLTWRINVHGADWKEAAGAYRDWLWSAFPLKEAQGKQLEWAGDISLAISWCKCDIDILKALKKRHPPGKTLLHVPEWRSDAYDENYPTYKPGSIQKEFIRQAKEMGFRVMPHFNFFAVDPNHPSYNILAPHIYREVDTGRLDGWGWDSAIIGIPQGGGQLKRNSKYKVMAYVHAGLGWWRAYLRKEILFAAREMGVDIIFADQTLNTYNLDNCLVEDMTPTEGMWHFTRDIAELGLGIAGEGLNEISMQYQSFAHAHLYKSYHENIEGLDRIPFPVNTYLFEGLCRTFGYCDLDGATEASRLRMKINSQLGVIPTLTLSGAGELMHPNKAVEAELQRAKDL